MKYSGYLQHAASQERPDGAPASAPSGLYLFHWRLPLHVSRCQTLLTLLWHPTAFSAVIGDSCLSYRWLVPVL